MTLKELIQKLREEQSKDLEVRNSHATALAELRGQEQAGAPVDSVTVEEHRSAKAKLDTQIDERQGKIAEFEAELERDENAAKLNERLGRKYDEVARVGAEKRTYSPDSDKGGKQFLRDIGLQFLGDFSARERLSRHMHEEQVERGVQFSGLEERAAGTGAFAGLVVPQYLTELYAPAAKANRPFANVCNQHELPQQGMTVNISRITTATTTAIQSSENSAVSETNIDDTLLSPSVQTNSGQQTLSRQAIERGTGVEDVMLDDLFRSYHTTLDSTLLNQATNGLTNVATSVAYTDASPTTAELYPKVLEALAGVEGALLDQDPGDNVAIMHSRRWYWMQNSVGSTWPFVQQPGIAPQMMATNFAERYGNGFRGVLPNGTPVIVDNNIATNLGAGTNEDEIYIGSLREFHLWEDSAAPMLIRAEQPSAASLGVLFVVYGYFAYTHARYAHARKIAGTGLVTPTFTGA